MTLIHASVVRFQNKGLMITGPSGSGKSDLALRLIDQGAKLVGDDYVNLSRTEDNQLVATVPDKIAGLIEVRGVGLVKMDHLPSAAIDLVIQLTGKNDIERLPEPDYADYEECRVPALKLYAFEASVIAKIKAAITHLLQ